MTRSLLSDAFAHHVWATEQLLDACSVLTAEQLITPTTGTYGPIIHTLRHIVQSDRWYVHFFPSAEGLALIADEDELSLPELRSEMAKNATAWNELLATEIDPDVEQMAHENGWEVYTPVGVRLAQVVHHGTDHRSQVCTALTSLGIEPPEIDVWAYAQATGRERALQISAE
jgi:uncharacterized damage-inducible protein DinB